MSYYNNRNNRNSYRNRNRRRRDDNEGEERFVSTMAKYERVPKKREDIAENEVRLRMRGGAGPYISRVAELMLRKEEPFDTVVLKGTGMVMAKVA